MHQKQIAIVAKKFFRRRESFVIYMYTQFVVRGKNLKNRREMCKSFRKFYRKTSGWTKGIKTSKSELHNFLV